MMMETVSRASATRHTTLLSVTEVLDTRMAQHTELQTVHSGLLTEYNAIAVSYSLPVMK
jgi:hypothetical protein